MAAYVIADTAISNAEAYETYKTQARALAEAHGGEYLVRGGRMRVDDDDLWTPTRLVIIRFPSFEQAEAFVNGADYAPVKALRQASAKSTLVIVEGI
jgi:uncharacterized protein (DUF1330 family)